MEHAPNERLNLIEYQFVMASATYLCKRKKRKILREIKNKMK